MHILAQPASASPELWSLGASSDFLGLTERSLRRYIAEGTLPAYRIGNRQIRVKRSDVEALLVPIPTVTGL
jgi:excisionase family DNA binding protein